MLRVFLLQLFYLSMWAAMPPSPLLPLLAGSLGIVLGGSLIVETLFDINGFGKFFYEAVINRDYNVIMFSALAGSFLTLCGLPYCLFSLYVAGSADNFGIICYHLLFELYLYFIYK